MVKFNCVLQQRTWRPSGHVDIHKAIKADTKDTLGRGVVNICSKSTSMCGQAFIKKTPQRTKHVLHMFCSRMVITLGSWHASGVELRSRVDGRCLPEQLRVPRTVPLASDTVAFLLPVVTEQHISASRAPESIFSLARHENGSNASIRHHLERPNIALSRNSDLAVFAHTGPGAKKLRAIGPNVHPRFVTVHSLGELAQPDLAQVDSAQHLLLMRLSLATCLTGTHQSLSLM